MTNKGGELTNIAIESGVSIFDGKAFCRVTCTSSDGDIWSGQLDPGTVRSLATSWFEAAGAAEHDAALLKFMKITFDIPEEAAATMLGELRKLRNEQ